MATTTVLNSFTVSSIIAELGGSPLPDYTYDFPTGLLTVASVNQTTLDAAVVALDVSTVAAKLALIKPGHHTRIDDAAEKARLRYITPGSGQGMVYQEKSSEADAYVLAGYPVDLTSYPFVQAEVNATGKTATVAADDIVAIKTSWITLAASIEETRISGKKGVTDATTEAVAKAAVDAAVVILDAV